MFRAGLRALSRTRNGVMRLSTDAVRQERVTRARRISLLSASSCIAIGGSVLIWRRLRSVDAAASALDESDIRDSKSKEESSLDEEDSVSRHKRTNFRDRRVIAYEDRIRAYSTPDKIFRYFATLRIVGANGEDEIEMTPEDFVRSLTPGVIQPEGLGLDQFRKISRKQAMTELSTQLDDGSLFSEIGHSGGLISFSDYLFLLTVLSTPKRHFEIAFQMFDLNGDGEVDASEFQKVCDILNKSTAVGQRHRDHSTTGSVAKGVGGVLQLYFFGPKLDQRLTVEKFGNFQARLKRELLRIEFDQYDPQGGLISEVDFCRLLLTYTNFSDSKKRLYRRRVKGAYRGNQKGISFEDFKLFSDFLDQMSEVETALSMYTMAGTGATKDVLAHVAKSVIGIELDGHLVDVVFTMFDVDEDGTLTNKEFISVMKDRRQRGLNKAKDSGLMRLLESAWSCAMQARPFG